MRSGDYPDDRNHSVEGMLALTRALSPSRNDAVEQGSPSPWPNEFPTPPPDGCPKSGDRFADRGPPGEGEPFGRFWRKSLFGESWPGWKNRVEAPLLRQQIQHRAQSNCIVPAQQRIPR